MIELNLLNVKSLKWNSYKTMKQTNNKYNIIKYKQLITHSFMVSLTNKRFKVINKRYKQGYKVINRGLNLV